MSHSLAADPRQPSAAKQYVPPVISQQDAPIDYAGFIAVICGVMGVMLRQISASSFAPKLSQWWCGLSVLLVYKLCSWLALIFCAQSLANMKNLETDLRQMSMAFMFAVMGLVTNYLSASKQGGGK